MNFFRSDNDSDENIFLNYNTKAIIDLKHIHNHELLCADVLKYRIPTKEVKAHFLKLFEEGKTPSKALFSYKSQLRLEKGNHYYVYAGDRGELPNPEWVYNLYYKEFSKYFGASHGKEMITSLKDAVEQYNVECSETCALIDTFEDGNFVIAIVSPLMKRISSGLDESGEILFIDASGNVDRYGCKIFLIYTNSCAGGLPVGTLILTSESTSIISRGLKLWTDLFSPSSLGGRSKRGPKVFMSDDSKAERNALNEIFPEATLLLCIFHVLQATWRYLWDSNHGVILKHRQILYNEIKHMMYSKSNEELELLYTKVIQNNLTKKYPKFESYVLNLYERRHEWALCLRKSIITRGQNTNNISEAGVKIVKDTILDRTKAYSPVQLFFFIVNDLEAFYEIKILDVAANRPAQYLKKKFPLTKTQIKHLEYKQLGSIFEVKNNSKNTIYSVDLDLGICSCPEGDTGKPCKHQIFIATDLKIDLSLCLPTTENVRKKLHTIATGSTEIHPGWYGVHTKINTNNIIEKNSKTTNEQELLNKLEKTTDNYLNKGDSEMVEVSDEADLLNINRTTEDECSNEENGLEVFDTVVKKIREAIESDPNYFLPGINAMNNSFNKNLKTHAGLLSAMMTFGKYSGIDPNSKRIKLVGNKRIGTQPTARPRRKTEIGGRKNLTAGRVPKWKRAPEHSYGQEPKSSCLPKKHKSFNPDVIPTKPYKNPHSLAHCTSQNKALGTTHCKK